MFKARSKPDSRSDETSFTKVSMKCIPSMLEQRQHRRFARQEKTMCFFRCCCFTCCCLHEAHYIHKSNNFTCRFREEGTRGQPVDSRWNYVNNVLIRDTSIANTSNAVRTRPIMMMNSNFAKCLNSNWLRLVASQKYVWYLLRWLLCCFNAKWVNMIQWHWLERRSDRIRKAGFRQTRTFVRHIRIIEACVWVHKHCCRSTSLQPGAQRIGLC